MSPIPFYKNECFLLPFLADPRNTLYGSFLIIPTIKIISDYIYITMSISNLLSPNGYRLFGESIDVKSLISEILEANSLDAQTLTLTDRIDTPICNVTNALSALAGTITTLSGTQETFTNSNVTNSTITNLISNKIKTSGGFNYLSPWDSTKSYIVGDLVMESNQIYRCLVNNTNIQPVPTTTNPSQLQWTQVTSNNALLNDRGFAQVSSVTGDNVKGLVTPQPFSTVRAAVDFINSNGGGVVRIVTVGQNILYPWTGGDLNGANNITIDGGDNSQSYLNNPNNVIIGDLIFTNCNNMTIKNVGMTRQTPLAIGFQLNSLGCKNVSFENMAFVDPPPPSSTLFLNVTNNGATPFGSHSFYNCYFKTDNDTFMSITFSGTCDPGTVITIDNANVPNISSLRLDTTTGGGLTTPENFKLIVRNSTVNIVSAPHLTGSEFVFINCIIQGALNSSASSGKITMINCSFLDPVNNAWAFIGVGMTGTATYQFIDCLLNPNTSSNILSSVSTSSNYLTSGPAARYNRIATWTAGAATSTGTTQAIVQVLPGATVTNPLNIITYNSGTGAITFTSPGVYEVLINLEITNTATANEQTALNYWFGISGSTESTALAVSSTDRPFLGSAGILATFPTSRRGCSHLISITSTSTQYFFYVRNLSAVAYNVTIQTMAVLQIR